MARVFIGLGSNQGDRKALLTDALKSLEAQDGITVVNQSLVYETSPVGGPEQSDYLNQVIEIETIYSPNDLLALLKETENKYGRTRAIKNGPRTLDCDILLYDDICISNEELTIPHPRMHERLFVIKPLADIAPNVVHPIKNVSIKKLLQVISNNSNNNETVQKYLA